MHRCAPLILLLLALTGLPARSLADDVAAAFDQANRLSEQGKYADAIAGYEKILGRGRASPALYFNLGNAWFKSGHLGRAILSYRLAARLAPRDADIRANLLFARGAVAGATPLRPPSWQRWAGRLSVNEWAVFSAIALWFWLGLLAAGLVWPSRRPTFHRSAVLGFLALALGLTGLAIIWHGRLITSAVVVEREVILRHGPLDDSPSLQTLHDGQELEVTDQKDNWLEVQGAARGMGWLRRDQVTLLDREVGR